LLPLKVNSQIGIDESAYQAREGALGRKHHLAAEPKENALNAISLALCKQIPY